MRPLDSEWSTEVKGTCSTAAAADTTASGGTTAAASTYVPGSTAPASVAARSEKRSLDMGQPLGMVHAE